MLVTSEAIVLHALKYGESDLITTLFTKSEGIKTYLIIGVLKSKKGKIRASFFQPLTLLDIEAVHKNKGTLERIREARISVPFKTLHTDVIKNALVFFMAEVTKNSIKEEEANEPLFHFLKNSVRWLDTHEQIYNFHIIYLIKLTAYLGFSPDITQVQYPYFDLENACFMAEDTGIYCRSGDYINTFKAFLGITFDAGISIKISRTTRMEILSMLLSYFELHLHGFKKPKSLAVLNEIFTS